MNNSKILGFYINSNTLVCVNYVLFFFGLFSIVPAVIAIVLAYSFRNKIDNINNSHIYFQIETFWSFLLIFLVGYMFTFMGIGWIVVVFAYIFGIIRFANGFRKAFEQDEILW